MIDVLIVDDHPVMRELLRQVLESYPDLTVVGEAGSGEDGVTQATQLQPAVALVDIHLPTMSGTQAAMLIKVQSPNTAVIGLTAGEPDHRDKAMIAAGATAVINKADVMQSLYPCIVNAVKGPGLKAVI
jgi:DNA-binding NarL/FixJ family response regulator